MRLRRTRNQVLEARNCCSRYLWYRRPRGVATLLLVVPLPLAAAHQAGAVLLFAAALNAAHALR